MVFKVQVKLIIVIISAMTALPKSYVYDGQQTLTCTISGLDNNQPVTVTWKETSSGPALVGDSSDTDYGIVQGTVSGSGTQDSVLTIKTDKMATLVNDQVYTYKCYAKSIQYSESAESAELDVEATFVGK